uniref:Uncharacterized protein n=1 Tax=Anopheles maculatus TaxID=74869 RepID=A0A182SCE6_9DIPT
MSFLLEKSHQAPQYIVINGGVGNNGGQQPTMPNGAGQGANAGNVGGNGPTMGGGHGSNQNHSQNQVPNSQGKCETRICGTQTIYYRNNCEVTGERAYLYCAKCDC